MMLSLGLLTLAAAGCHRKSAHGVRAHIAPAYRAELEAICEAPSRAQAEDLAANPALSLDTHVRFGAIRAWLAAHVASPQGKKLLERLIPVGDEPGDPTALLQEAKRARLPACFLGEAMMRRRERRQHRAEVIALCQASVTNDSMILTTPEGHALEERLHDEKTRGSSLRHEVQLLSIDPCPRADAWDAAVGLEAPSPARYVVVQVASFVSQDVSANGVDARASDEAALAAAHPALEACGRAIVASDPLFADYIHIRIESAIDNPNDPLPQTRITPGNEAIWHPDAFTCFLDALPRHFASKAGRVSFHVRALQNGVDTWTAVAKQKGTIALSDVKSDGGLAAATAQTYLTPAVMRARACGVGELTGTMEVEAIIDLNGAADRVTATGGSAVVDDEHRSCILGAFLDAAYPEPGDSKTKLAFKLTFGG